MEDDRGTGGDRRIVGSDAVMMATSSCLSRFHDSLRMSAFLLILAMVGSLRGELEVWVE